jgi:SET domain-containing protein
MPEKRIKTKTDTKTRSNGQLASGRKPASNGQLASGRKPASNGQLASSRNPGSNGQTITRRRKILVRDSRIHGRGVYALRAIREGERIIEYRGERITWREADRRPPSDPDDPHHTFYFSLDDGRHVIDANVGGNSARWINHSCEPNCETEETDDGRVYIQALRDIRRGEELSYDYCLVVDERLTPTLKRQYQCRCGSLHCRGTMLALKKRNGVR